MERVVAAVLLDVGLGAALVADAVLEERIRHIHGLLGAALGAIELLQDIAAGLVDQFVGALHAFFYRVQFHWREFLQFSITVSSSSGEICKAAASCFRSSTFMLDIVAPMFWTSVSRNSCFGWS